MWTEQTPIVGDTIRLDFPDRASIVGIVTVIANRWVTVDVGKRLDWFRITDKFFVYVK